MGMVVRRILKVVGISKKQRTPYKTYEYRYGILTITVPEEWIGKHVEVIVAPIE